MYVWFDFNALSLQARFFFKAAKRRLTNQAESACLTALRTAVAKGAPAPLQVGRLEYRLRFFLGCRSSASGSVLSKPAQQQTRLPLRLPALWADRSCTRTAPICSRRSVGGSAAM